MRANRANIQHAATKITNMPYWGQWLRLLVLNELNSNYTGLHVQPIPSPSGPIWQESPNDR